MTALVEGVRFRAEVPDGGHLADRLSISGGTVSAAAPAGSGSSRYREWARVPRESWGSPSAEDLAVLIATGRTEVEEVQILRVPLELTERIRASLGELRSYVDEADFIRAMASEVYLQAMADFGHYVEHLGEVTKKSLVRINRWGLRTTTVDNEQVYIGLHVDNWYQQDLPTRASSPNRLCVNVSEEARYLLLMNVPLETMLSMLTQGADECQLHPSMVGTPLGLAFMQTFPNYPVLKLRIEPGEAYLAPTENLVHDGCTEGMTCWDLAIHVLGRFAPRAVATASMR